MQGFRFYYKDVLNQPYEPEDKTYCTQKECERAAQEYNYLGTPHLDLVEDDDGCITILKHIY